ncbi:hypothetical protein VTK56DRAFT_6989 [Thermocarpiscus australiensis]
MLAFHQLWLEDLRFQGTPNAPKNLPGHLLVPESIQKTSFAPFLPRDRGIGQLQCGSRDSATHQGRPSKVVVRKCTARKPIHARAHAIHLASSHLRCCTISATLL